MECDPPPPYPLLPTAVAPSAAGAAVHRGQHARLGTPAPWRSAGWLRRPGRTGGPRGRSDRRLGAGRYRGLHGGSGGLNGTLGPGAPPSPAQPEEVSLQRQQQAGPLAGGGGVSDQDSASSPDDLTDSTAAPSLTVFLIYFVCVSQDRAAVSHRPVLQLGSAWFSSALMVRRRPPALHHATQFSAFIALSSLLRQDGDAAFQPGGLRLGSGGAGRRHHTGPYVFPVSSQLCSILVTF